MRIVQITDTHISHRGGVTNQNFARIAAFVNASLRPDLIVNTGDIVILDPDVEADRAAAVELHRLFDAPLRFVPGNHDVGQPGGAPWMGLEVNGERVESHVAAFGPDRWVEHLGDWCVIGINSELIGSGLSEEEQQWQWLSDTVAARPGTPAILFMHRPPWAPAGRENTAEHLISLADEERERLLTIMSPMELAAVGSGHLHMFSCALNDGVLAVGGPSTAFTVGAPGSHPGLAQLGVVEYSDDSGRLDVKFRTLHDLAEGEPWDLPSFADTLRDVEARMQLVPRGA